MLYYIMLCYIILYYITLHHFTSHYTTLHQTEEEEKETDQDVLSLPPIGALAAHLDLWMPNRYDSDRTKNSCVCGTVHACVIVRIISPPLLLSSPISQDMTLNDKNLFERSIT